MTALGAVSVEGNGSAHVVLVGRAVAIHAALHGVRFTPTADFNGSAGLRIATSDGVAPGMVSNVAAAAEDQRITLAGVNLFTANGLGTNSNDTALLQRQLERGSIVVDP